MPSQCYYGHAHISVFSTVLYITTIIMLSALWSVLTVCCVSGPNSHYAHSVVIVITFIAVHFTSTVHSFTNTIILSWYIFGSFSIHPITFIIYSANMNFHYPSSVNYVCPLSSLHIYFFLPSIHFTRTSS